MKQVSKLLFTALLFCGAQITHAQSGVHVGGMLAYGSEIENVGIGVNAEIPVFGKLSVSPSIIYYLPKSYWATKVNWFEINANANYRFLDLKLLNVYGLAGINYTNVKVNYDGPYDSLIEGKTSDGRVGFNIGGGANFKLGKITPFAELKYVIIDDGQVVLAAGVKLNL